MPLTHVTSANPWMTEGPRGDGITTDTTWIQQVQPGLRKSAKRYAGRYCPWERQSLVALVLKAEMGSTTPLPIRALCLSNQSI